MVNSHAMADAGPALRGMAKRNADRMLHIANNLIDLDLQRSGSLVTRTVDMKKSSSAKVKKLGQDVIAVR